MKKTVILLSLCVVKLALGGENQELIHEVEGRYPINSWAESNQVTGRLEIGATSEGVGVVVRQLEVIGESSKELKFLSPTDSTTFEKKDNTVVQDYKNGDDHLKIIYGAISGFMTADINLCEKGKCSSFLINYTEDALGVEADAKALFQGLDGHYKVEKVNGEVPKQNEVADVIFNTDDSDTYMPYCAVAGLCEEGRTNFVFSSTKVYKKDLGNNRTINTIVSLVDNRPYYFTWDSLADSKGSSQVFRNFQYKSKQGVIFVEHSLQK